MKTFKTAAATNRAINKLNKSEAITYKLNKLDASLIAHETSNGWTIFCVIPTSANINESCALTSYINQASK